MSKKLTYEFVKSQFEKEGYTLLTKEYKNAHQKLDYICPNNHRHSITWASWQQGHRCYYCVGKAKKTIEEVREAFESEGYTLLTKEYKNNQQKLKYICPNGHKHSIKWHNWYHGYRCPYCSGNTKKTIEEVREAFKSENYILLTKEYKNAFQKLKFICPNGHKHSITWANFQRGQRCPYCINKNIKKTIEEIREAFESEGYTLLTKEYKNNSQKLKYICPQGHRHSISWHEWQQGTRCSYCAHIKIANKRKLDYEFVKSEFEKEGCKLLTKEYKNCYQKLEYICPRGHRHSIKWNSWQQGHRCFYCYHESKIKYYTKEDLEKYNTYRETINSLTRRIYYKYKSYINPNNYRRGKHYHLDHIYSVIDGFENDIPVEIISNPNNLRLIPAKENLNKNGNSYISKMMLYHLAI